MVVSVSVSLLRPNGVYLAGETVECRIVIRSRMPQETDSGVVDVSSPTSEHGVCLAWACCQLHCQQIVSESRAKRPPKPATKTSSSSTGQNETADRKHSTSLSPNSGEQGLCIYSSKPHLLFCDLSILPGEELVYHYSDTLPSPLDDARPSFRGYFLKYNYRLSLAVQQVGASIRTLKVPLRVLLLEGLGRVKQNPALHQHHVNGEAVGNGNGAHLGPTNPFLLSTAQQTASQDLYIQAVANDIIEGMTAPKDCHIYNITYAESRIARLLLAKTCFRLGEVVTGQFELLESANVRCLQFLASLQSVEELQSDFRLATQKDSQSYTQTRTWSKQHEFCAQYTRCAVRLPIPMEATQSFFDEIVHNRWIVHFEFVVTSDAAAGTQQTLRDGSVMHQPPARCAIETLQWSCPIKVYPTSPRSIPVSPSSVDGQFSRDRIRKVKFCKRMSADTAPSSSYEDRMAKLRELKKRRIESQKLNHMEVVEEDKRAKLPNNWEQRKRRAEWELEQQGKREDAEERGEDYERERNLQIGADVAEKMSAAKARKSNPDVGFSTYEDATARQYNRLIRQLKPDMKSYDDKRKTVGDELFYPSTSTLIVGTHTDSKDDIDRMVADMNKQDLKRKKFHRRRDQNPDSTITFINERNRKFNEKIERFYGPYTKEIKDNIERGTAV